MKTPHRLALALCVSAAASLIPSAFAVDNIWNNGTTDWALGTNWSLGTPAGSGDVAVFSSVDGTQTINLNGNRAVQGLSFTHIGATTLSAGTPTTSSLTIGSSGVSVTAGGLVNVSINLDTILSANQTWSSNGGIAALRVEKTLNTAGFTATINGASSVTISGSVSGGGGFIKDGTNVLTLFGNNSFSGGVVLNSGYLRLEKNTSLGSGTLTINGTTSRIGTSNTSAVTASNAVEVNGNFSYSSGPGQMALTLTGTMDLNGASRTITQGETLAGGHFINGVISNGGIVKAGTGTLTLGGVNTYTGNTTVSAGTLILADNSQSAFTIGANGVNNQFNGTGTLTLNGDFSFNLGGAGTTLGDSWNIVSVGTLAETFGATFSVVGFSDIGGNLWEITNVNGGRTYRFDETTGNLAVTAVPEPATWALLAGSLTVVMVLRRRRRTA